MHLSFQTVVRYRLCALIGQKTNHFSTKLFPAAKNGKTVSSITHSNNKRTFAFSSKRFFGFSLKLLDAEQKINQNVSGPCSIFFFAFE
jgi:hypothetical protein